MPAFLKRWPIFSQVNTLGAVCTCVVCLIGPFAMESHLSRKHPLPLIVVPFAQAAGKLPACPLTPVVLPQGCGSGWKAVLLERVSEIGVV